MKSLLRLAATTMLMTSMLLSMGSLCAGLADVEAAMSHDGLEKISVKDVDLAYARPGASLAGYGKVKLDPIEVAFHKDWNPTKPGTNFPLSTRDRENIRTGVAKLVYEEFAKELQAKGSYQVVSEAGPDVLRVKATIVNLYVTAPDTSVAIAQAYTVSAGEMTLVLELYDSQTGEALARLVDRRESRGTGRLSLSNSIVNANEARAMVSAWARILRKALDKAHGIGKK